MWRMDKREKNIRENKSTYDTFCINWNKLATMTSIKKHNFWRQMSLLYIKSNHFRYALFVCCCWVFFFFFFFFCGILFKLLSLYLTVLKADMNSNILLKMAAIIFCYRTFIQNRVLARCMSWLISFAWTSSGCKERKRDLWNDFFSCPQRDSNSQPLDCKTTTVTVRSLDLTHYRQV